MNVHYFTIVNVRYDLNLECDILLYVQAAILDDTVRGSQITPKVPTDLHRLIICAHRGNLHIEITNSFPKF